jgi:S1-C subfamily serine protease
VEAAPLAPGLAKIIRGVPDHGVLVVRVLPGSPAAKAGLVAGSKQVTVNGESVLVGGDAILAVGGRRVETPVQLADVVQAHEPGDELTLQVARNGHVRSVTLTLGNAPSST